MIQFSAIIFQKNHIAQMYYGYLTQSKENSATSPLNKCGFMEAIEEGCQSKQSVKS